MSCHEFTTNMEEKAITGYEVYLVFEDGDPVRVVDSMDKFSQIVKDNPSKKYTWLSYEVE